MSGNGGDLAKEAFVGQLRSTVEGIRGQSEEVLNHLLEMDPRSDVYHAAQIVYHAEMLGKQLGGPGGAVEPDDGFSEALDRLPGCDRQSDALRLLSEVLKGLLRKSHGGQYLRLMSIATFLEISEQKVARMEAEIEELRALIERLEEIDDGRELELSDEGDAGA